MFRNGRPRLTHGTVVAYLALFVALGGTSYAAMQLPKNSVGSKQIARNAVKADELAAGSVRSAEVKDYSLRARDFARGELPQGLKGDAGPRGATGPRGPAGKIGPRGPSDVVYAEQRNVSITNDCTDATELARVSVPAGTWLVNGGASFLDLDIDAGTRHDVVTILRVGGTPVQQGGAVTSIVEAATHGAQRPSAYLAPRAVVTTTAASTTISMGACAPGSIDVRAALSRLDALQVEKATKQ